MPPRRKNDVQARLLDAKKRLGVTESNPFDVIRVAARKSVLGKRQVQEKRTLARGGPQRAGTGAPAGRPASSASTMADDRVQLRPSDRGYGYRQSEAIHSEVKEALAGRPAEGFGSGGGRPGGAFFFGEREAAAAGRGGPQGEAVPGARPEQKSAKEVYSEIIAKSRQARQERQEENEEVHRKVKELDQQYTRLMSRLPQKGASDVPSSASLGPAGLGSGFDLEMEQRLLEERRVASFKGTVTREAIVRDGAHRLQELEELRLRRGQSAFLIAEGAGAKVQEELDAMSHPPAGGTADAVAENLDGDFEGELPEPSSSDTSGDFGSSASSGDSEPEFVTGAVPDDGEGDRPLGGEQSDAPPGIVDDEEAAGAGETPRQGGASLPVKGDAAYAEDPELLNIPFTLPVPDTQEQFDSLMDGVFPASEVILYDRLIKTNSTLVNKENVQKMEKLAKYAVHRLAACAAALGDVEEAAFCAMRSEMARGGVVRGPDAPLGAQPGADPEGSSADSQTESKPDMQFVQACLIRIDAAMRCMGHVATEVPGYSGGVLRNELNAIYARTRKTSFPVFRALILLRCVPAIFPQSRYTVQPGLAQRRPGANAPEDADSAAGDAGAQGKGGAEPLDLSAIPSGATRRYTSPPAEDYSNPIYEAALQLLEYSLLCLLRGVPGWDQNADEARVNAPRRAQGRTLLSPAGLFLVQCGVALVAHTGVYVPVLVQALEKMISGLAFHLLASSFFLPAKPEGAPEVPIPFAELVLRGEMFTHMQTTRCTGFMLPGELSIAGLRALDRAIVVLARLYQGLPCAHLFAGLSESLSFSRIAWKGEAGKLPRPASVLLQEPGNSLQPMHLLPPPVPAVKELSPAFMAEFRPGKTMDANTARQKARAEEQRARRLQRDEYREAARTARASVRFKQENAARVRERRTQLANRVSESFMQENSRMKRMDKASRRLH